MFHMNMLPPPSWVNVCVTLDAEVYLSISFLINYIFIEFFLKLIMQ